MELSQIKGVGKARLDALRAAGITSLRDLLYTLPAGYKDTTAPIAVCDVQPGQTVCVRGHLRAEAKVSYFRGVSRVTAQFVDETGKINLVWFNQPWMVNNLHDLGEILLYGRVDEKNGKPYMNSPSLETEEKLTALYHAVPGVPQKVMGQIVQVALTQVDDCCPETLPNALRLRYSLCEKNYAIRQAHQPESRDALEMARRRLSFEQLLMYQAALSLAKGKKEKGIVIPCNDKDAETFWKSLPFAPTNAQKRVLKEAMADLRAPYPMARLVQGDVGSGKTAIAFAALYLSAKAGFQGALMAPTEILARQHLESAKRQLEPLGVRCGLLLGGMKAKERREALSAIESGEWQVVIGTHALLSQGVAYHNLGLTITDEQHRFGVRQRTALTEKGKAEGENAPNVLVMSATPIPRTLALILYGDLDVSVVDELPPGRKPVLTRIVPDEKREGMYAFLRAQVENGFQAYVVCPLVEDSEMVENVKSAQTHFKELCAGPLSGIAVGLTYGKQPDEEKQQVLKDFSSGKIRVLVATTVIEVGVNVPNATIMVIENADRYGLSQLHQLRGRVGRGKDESWCFLLAKPNERLRSLTKTNDGFAIARKDLELRGPGEFLGTRQHGAAVLPGGISLYGDVQLLEETQKCMMNLRRDPELKEEKEAVERVAQQVFSQRLKEIALN